MKKELKIEVSVKETEQVGNYDYHEGDLVKDSQGDIGMIIDGCDDLFTVYFFEENVQDQFLVGDLVPFVGTITLKSKLI